MATTNRKHTRSLVKPDASVASNARRSVAAQTAAFFAGEACLNDPDAATELHEMRIAAKRLRYTMELFGPVLGPEVDDSLAIVKEFQEIAGEIHDADVRAGMLRAYLHERAAAAADALSARAADDDVAEIDTLKTEARAQVTADEWTAEQVALTAAIARTLAARRERYAHLRARWAEWLEADLHGRLDALSHPPAPAHRQKKGGLTVFIVPSSAQEPMQDAMPAL